MTSRQIYNFNQLLFFIKQPVMLKYAADRGYPLKLNVKKFFYFYYIFLVMYCLLKYSEFFFLKSNKNIKHLFVQLSLNQQITQKILIKNQKLKYQTIKCKNIRVGFLIFDSFFRLLKKETRTFIRQKRPENLYQLREIIGYYIGYNIIELNKNLKSITIGNDHRGLEIGLVNQAIKANIKTIYRQHAHVNRYFPRIKLDKYILFNKFSAKIYGFNFDECFLINRDNLLKINISKMKILETDKKYTIGLAFNSIPNISELISACNTMSEKYKISIRLHNSTFDEVIKKIPNKFKHLIKNKKLYKWFESVDCVIAGNSGILIDSILHNKPCIYYSKLDFFRNDYYKFVKYGFVPKLTSLQKFKLNCKNSFYTKKWKKYCTDQLICNSTLEKKLILSIYG